MHYSIGKRSAFTLIELLIVVAIIAILAAIAVPNFLEAQTRAKVASVKSDMRSLTTALESYYVDWENYVPNSNNSPVNGNEFVYPSHGTMHYRSGTVDQGGFFYMLSTPVAYIANSFIRDPFISPASARSTTWYNSDNVQRGYIRYTAHNRYRTVWWQGAAHAHSSRPLTYRGEAGWKSRATPSLNADNYPEIRWWFLYSAGPDTIHGAFQSYTAANNGATLFSYADFDKSGAFLRWPTTFLEPSGAGMRVWSTAAASEMVSHWIYDPTNGTRSQGLIWRVGGTIGEYSGQSTSNPDNGSTSWVIQGPLAEMTSN